MADADEDIIPRNGPSAEDTDLSDETQDFRFLAAISYVPPPFINLPHLPPF